MIEQEVVRADFRRVVVKSSKIAGAAIIAQLAVALVAFALRGHSSRLLLFGLGILALLSLFCGIACMVLFISSLLAYRLKGLWLAMPAIAAWALPVGFVLAVSRMHVV